MKWFILLVGVVVVCLFVALVLGLAGGVLGRAGASLSHEPLPDDHVDDADFDDLVFDVGLRGYRMSQVDGVVDRLRRELRERDEEIAVLRGTTAPDPDPAQEQAQDPAQEQAPDQAREQAEPGEAPEVPTAADSPDEPAPAEQPRPGATARSTGTTRTP